jgi:hypothetical protein
MLIAGRDAPQCSKWNGIVTMSPLRDDEIRSFWRDM